jgi:CcdB protein
VVCLIVLQSSALAGLATTMVAPVSEIAAGSALTKVNIPIRIEDEIFHVMMPELGALPNKQLGGFIVNTEIIHDSVMAAIELMLAEI